jgi:hypothetical protein
VADTRCGEFASDFEEYAIDFETTQAKQNERWT